MLWAVRAALTLAIFGLVYCDFDEIKNRDFMDSQKQHWLLSCGTSLNSDLPIQLSVTVENGVRTASSRVRLSPNTSFEIRNP